MANSISNSPSNSSNTSGDEKCHSLRNVRKLSYEIHRCSSFSGNCFPENVMIDRPSDANSSWMVQSNFQPQFLTLKLKRPAIVKSIKFGKCEKRILGNLKKFKILGGLEEDNLSLLFEGGLKTNILAETFELRQLTENGSENLISLYIKIVPLASWGPAATNFCIWYIELLGEDDPMFINNTMTHYNILREMEVVRLCLKHFRQQGYVAAFKALQEQTQVQLEHPLITELHKCLVLQGDFEKTEKLITECVNNGLMDAYLNRQPYKYKWTQQCSDGIQPGNRGGHQLVLHSKKRKIYLYGGWDGFRDLSDVWLYDIPSNTWSLLYEKSEEFNGPHPRSCHKMVFDPLTENIFMIGRYLDNSIRTTDYVKSDFYMFDTKTHTWVQVCDDTSQVNGPQLVYDHQMCIDVAKRTIYVFGGKVLTPRSVNASTSTSDPEFSGLYSYHIDTNTWTSLLVDCNHPNASQPDVQSIKSRITHCMVFHNKNRKLYIYGGQRGKEDLDEFLTYDVDTNTLTTLKRHSLDDAVVSESSNDSSTTGTAVNSSDIQIEIKTEPSPGYTLRASIDCDREEIYVFSSLSKLKDRRENHQVDPSNSLWVYSLRLHKWSLIYSHRSNDPMNGNIPHKPLHPEPCPRYAHQMIYDDVDKVHYLFGGNPGKSNQPQLRLDDFWTLTLQKPTREEIQKHCCFLIRKLHYEEMARADPYKAMVFLRNQISDVIDHNDIEQLQTFHSLASLLFKPDELIVDRAITTTPPLGISPFIETVEQINSTNFNMTEFKLPKSFIDEDFTQKSDSLAPNDDYSIESCENLSNTTASSSATDISSDALTSSYNQYIKAGGKKPRHDFMYNTRTRRSFLFNSLVELMPQNMVQPENNLTDFVTRQKKDNSLMSRKNYHLI